MVHYFQAAVSFEKTIYFEKSLLPFLVLFLILHTNKKENTVFQQIALYSSTLHILNPYL